jgi:hypothetical protein
MANSRPDREQMKRENVGKLVGPCRYHMTEQSKSRGAFCAAASFGICDKGEDGSEAPGPSFTFLFLEFQM